VNRLLLTIATTALCTAQRAFSGCAKDRGEAAKKAAKVEYP